MQERPLPSHVGIIMDGNGRWAEMRGLPRMEGHREGSTSVREVTRCARRVGLKALTLYAFSSQNWARPAEEVAALMDLLREYLESEREEILQNGIRLNAIGEVDKLPRFVKEPLDRLRAESAKNTGMVLTLALSYGGREELLQAARRVAEAASRGELAPENLDSETFESSARSNVRWSGPEESTPEFGGNIVRGASLKAMEMIRWPSAIFLPVRR